MVKLTVKEELVFLQKVEMWIRIHRHTKNDQITWSRRIDPPSWMKDKRFTSFRSSIYFWNGYYWVYDLKFEGIIQKMMSERRDKMKDVKEWLEATNFDNQNTLDRKVADSKVDKESIQDKNQDNQTGKKVIERQEGSTPVDNAELFEKVPFLERFLTHPKFKDEIERDFKWMKLSGLCDNVENPYGDGICYSNEDKTIGFSYKPMAANYPISEFKFSISGLKDLILVGGGIIGNITFIKKDDDLLLYFHDLCGADRDQHFLKIRRLQKLLSLCEMNGDNGIMSFSEDYRGKRLMLTILIGNSEMTEKVYIAIPPEIEVLTCGLCGKKLPIASKTCPCWEEDE